MKKIILPLAALLLCLAFCASAETVTSLPSADLASFLAGRTFTVRASGFAMMEGADHATLSFTVCEREIFDAASVEALAPGDEIEAADGQIFQVTSVRADEYGLILNENDPYERHLIFTREEDGRYSLTDDTDYPFWRTTFSFDVPADADLVYLDWSDPEAEAPVQRTLLDYIEDYQNDTLFDENNTQITFDGDGRLTQLLRNYSPWN